MQPIQLCILQNFLKSDFTVRSMELIFADFQSGQIICVVETCHPAPWLSPELVKGTCCPFAGTWKASWLSREMLTAAFCSEVLDGEFLRKRQQALGASALWTCTHIFGMDITDLGVN